MRRLAASAALMLLLGCGSADRCPPQTSAAFVETLYFGTARPEGVVSDEEFRAFVADVITPRFPEGLTISQASGQWRDSGGTIVRERSFVVQWVAQRPAESAIAEIIDAYKKRFQQEAVLRVRTKTCAGF